MNPDIERVQQYSAISQKVPASRQQQEKRKPKKESHPLFLEEPASIEDENTGGREVGIPADSEQRLDITT